MHVVFLQVLAHINYAASASWWIEDKGTAYKLCSKGIMKPLFELTNFMDPKHHNKNDQIILFPGHQLTSSAEDPCVQFIIALWELSMKWRPTLKQNNERSMSGKN